METEGASFLVSFANVTKRREYFSLVQLFVILFYTVESSVCTCTCAYCGTFALKGTLALDRAKMFYEKRLKPFIINCLIDVFKVDYHT